MPDSQIEDELRSRARELVVAGQLPCGRPMHMWGGSGSDLPCSLCQERIPRSEVEYELEYRIAGGTRQYRFHFYCHTAWQLECAHADALKGAAQ